MERRNTNTNYYFYYLCSFRSDRMDYIEMIEKMISEGKLISQRRLWPQLLQNPPYFLGDGNDADFLLLAKAPRSSLRKTILKSLAAMTYQTKLEKLFAYDAFVRSNWSFVLEDDFPVIPTIMPLEEELGEEETKDRHRDIKRGKENQDQILRYSKFYDEFQTDQAIPLTRVIAFAYPYTRFFEEGDAPDWFKDEMTYFANLLHEHGYDMPIVDLDTFKDLKTLVQGKVKVLEYRK